MASPKKVRQFCKACNQITTQVKDAKAPAGWQCLCCESAKLRSTQKTEGIKKKNTSSRRLNMNF